MYDYILARCLAYERHIDLRRLAEEARLIASAEERHAQKQHVSCLAKMRHLLRSLLIDPVTALTQADK